MSYRRSIFLSLFLVVVGTRLAESQLINCSPRTFALLAPCQDTCSTGKPTICIRKPGCYCPKGIWDDIKKACVEPADCSPETKTPPPPPTPNVSASVSIKAKGRLAGIIGTILNVPIKIMKTGLELAYKLGLKTPLNLVTQIVEILTLFLEQFTKLNSEIVANIISLIKQIIAKISKTLVDVGVFQGKSTEDVLNLITNIVKKIISFAINLEVKISTYIVDSGLETISILKIREIKQKILDLPVIKNIKTLIVDIVNFVQTHFQTQISEIRNFIKSLIEQHKDFFQPIFDGISSRFLIVINALHAFVDGNLQECPGMDGPDQSPTDSLQRRLNILIDKIKIAIERTLGWKAWADAVQNKLNETTIHPPSELPTPPSSVTPPSPPSTVPPYGTTMMAMITTMMAKTTTMMPPSTATTPSGDTTTASATIHPAITPAATTPSAKTLAATMTTTTSLPVTTEPTIIQPATTTSSGEPTTLKPTEDTTPDATTIPTTTLSAITLVTTITPTTSQSVSNLSSTIEPASTRPATTLSSGGV